MDFREYLRVGSCVCAVGLGLAVEFAHVAHAPYCPQYRKDVIVCGKAIEVIIPEHNHNTESNSLAPPQGATIVSSVGATHRLS